MLTEIDNDSVVDQGLTCLRVINVSLTSLGCNKHDGSSC